MNYDTWKSREPDYGPEWIYCAFCMEKHWSDEQCPEPEPGQCCPYHATGGEQTRSCNGDARPVRPDSVEPLTEQMVEDYINKHGMTRLLALLMLICHEKAEHIDTNWGAGASDAKAWRRGAALLERPAAFRWPL